MFFRTSGAGTASRGLPLRFTSHASRPLHLHALFFLDLRRHFFHFRLDQSICRQNRLAAQHVGFPSRSVIFPPASSTSTTPAAVSHGFRPNSQNPSNLPAATYARSSAADPSRRTPCECSVKSQ